MRALAILLLLIPSSYCLTKVQFDEIYLFFEDYYLQNEYELPIAVRLGFHDCVGVSCDGCINMANPGNYGLDMFINKLEDIYHTEEFAEMCSKADFWAISAYAAVGRAIKNANLDCNRKSKFRKNKGRGKKDNFVLKQKECVPDLEFTFKWGREDCPTSPTTDDWHQFPSPDMTGDAMFKYFQDNFNFSKGEVTALMGAHTLGRAKGENSGYDGVWVYSGPFDFDNEYYSIMIDEQVIWFNVNNAGEGSPAKYQFNGINVTDDSPVGFMLNTDFELFYNLTLGNKGEALCDVNMDAPDICPHSSTYPDAFAFSQDVSLFIDEFGLVFTKMLEKTTSNLQYLQ